MSNLEFNDEIVSKFCYDADNRIIEIYYSNFLTKDDKGEKSFKNLTFTIKNWKSAKSRLGDEIRAYDLDRHLGIFSMIIHAENVDGYLTLIVNTIDDRYITLKFEDPELTFKTH